MASVYAARYRKQPDVLRAAVMGQSPDRSLDSYTALNALKLVKEADMMDMAGQAQQPTSAPSFVAQVLTPPAPPQGLGAMIPMGAPAGQMPQQRAPMPQPVMQAASGGLAGMYTPEEDYAEGGIVAFSGTDGSVVRDPEALAVRADPMADFAPAVSADPFADYIAGTANGVPNTTAIGRAQEALEKYMDYEPKEMTTAEQEAFLDRYMARVEKAGGPNIYAPARERLKTREGALAGDRRTGEGIALLTAAGKILKGRSLAEGASEALPAYAQQIGEVRRAEQQEMRAIEQMNFALADAERKERMGNQRGAQAALEAARKFQQDANRAHGDKLRFAADIAARTVGYSKVNKAAGDASTKLPQVDREAALITKQIIALEAKDPNDPQIAVLKKQRAGLIEILGTGKEGPTAATRATNQLTGAQNRQLSKEMSAWQDSTEAKKALKAGTFDEAYDAEFTRRQNALMSGISTTPSSGNVINYDANGKRIN